jgi:hypothetical protein
VKPSTLNSWLLAMILVNVWLPKPVGFFAACAIGGWASAEVSWDFMADVAARVKRRRAVAKDRTP